MRTKVAILGSGNIGADLMVKIVRTSAALELAAVVGIDPDSEGLALARRMGIPATHGGIEEFVRMPEFVPVRIVLDATSARAHARHDQLLRARRKQVIDLTPAAIGPYVVPVVNLEEHFGAPNLSMVSCGGQATIPMVAAVHRVARVQYAEIVASIASRSAGPGTRANIDEFTRATARAIERVGGAARGKAIIVLNPAEPPLLMRNTIFCLTPPADPADVTRSVERMVAEVAAYVPGYRLKQRVQFEEVPPVARLTDSPGLKCTIFLEIEGAGHYLPPYAGNLDIMTSAALATAERLASREAIQ